jgi:hypothetical protein
MYEQKLLYEKSENDFEQTLILLENDFGMILKQSESSRMSGVGSVSSTKEFDIDLN